MDKDKEKILKFLELTDIILNTYGFDNGIKILTFILYKIEKKEII